MGLGLGGRDHDVAVDFSRLCGEKGCARTRTNESAGVAMAGADTRDVGQALHRLVTADVLVMSRSALSYAAAMLTNGTVFFPSCWLEHRRVLPTWRIWPCCPTPSEQPKAGRCAGDSWKKTWKDLRRLKY